jgi:hypothetical protein
MNVTNEDLDPLPNEGTQQKQFKRSQTDKRTKLRQLLCLATAKENLCLSICPARLFVYNIRLSI